MEYNTRTAASILSPHSFFGNISNLTLDKQAGTCWLRNKPGILKERLLLTQRKQQTSEVVDMHRDVLTSSVSKSASAKSMKSSVMSFYEYPTGMLNA